MILTSFFVDSNALYALGLTLFAGLSTGIGSGIALVAKKTNTTLLAVSLGLSAGVMIYISFMELFATSLTTLRTDYGAIRGELFGVLAFFGGILLIMLLDFVIPEDENPHEMHIVEDLSQLPKPRNHHNEHSKSLHRVGVMSAVVIAIHNFPEGMVTFLTALNDSALAIPIAIAIAIHNIPEGISVAVPIYYATGNRKKAFWTSFFSGLAEPVGAGIAYLILAPFLTPALISILNAVIAGIMVYISLDELLPAAEAYGKHHLSILGLVAGMAVMALTLLIL